MASSLSQALRSNRQGVTKRGPGGQLSQESPEEIQTLAGQAGLQAPPTTPVGAAGIGANADQQKMMGTPAQKEAAFSLAQVPVESGLAAAMRRGQARTEKTEEEKAQEQKSQDMENLGSLGTRVNDFINVQRQALQNQALAATTQNQLEVRSAEDPFNGKDLSSIKTLLQTYRDNPTDQNVLLELNKALGYDINRQLSTAEVDQLYESAVSTISRGGAGNVDDDLNVEDLLQQQDFGYDKTQLSQLLGIPEESVGKLSVGQLRAEIERVGNEEFAQSEKLDEKAQSGLLGQAERGLAAQAGREASATGVRATEQDYANLEQQISQADKVFFDGKEFNVEDLLKDETISGIISDYMNAGPDSEIRKQLDQFEPKLAEFIKKNQSVLAEASSNMQAGAGEFVGTQDFNKSLQTIGGIKMVDSLIDTFLGKSRELQSEKINPQDVPLYAASQELPQGQQQAYMNNLNTEVQRDPETIQDLKDLSTDQIKAWQIGGDGSSPWQTNYIAPKRTYENIVTAGNDTNQLVKIAVRNVTGLEQAASKLSDTRAIGALGFGPGAQSNIIDVNGDGNVDSPSAIRSGLLAANPRPSLKGGPGSNKVYEAIDLASAAELNERQRKIFGALSWATGDGYIQAGDLQNSKGKLDLDDMIELKYGKRNGAMDYGAVDGIWSEKRDSNTGSTISRIDQEGGSSMDKIEKLANELRSQTDKKLNPDMMGNKTKDLLDQIARDEANASAEDRARTRHRIRQQKQLISVAVPVFAVLPPEMQDAIMNSATEVGGAVIDELKKIEWDPSRRTVPETIAIAARQLTTSPYRALAAGVGGVAQSVGNAIGGDVGRSISNVGGAVSSIGGGGGCFQAGTEFFVMRPTYGNAHVPVEEIQPGDYMTYGGKVIATAQFVGNEIYEYKGIIVNGSHAVLEDKSWVRVRDSKIAVRQPDMDGIKVYVVWNERHRMVSVDGTIWTDYAETDSTVVDIEEQRNLELLNTPAS